MTEPVGAARVVAPAESLAFQDFFRAEYAGLARALLLLTGSVAEAEDLAQEALSRVYERWERVRAMDSPVGYAYRTAMNLHRSRLRRLAVRARRTERALGSEPDHAEAAGARADVLRAMREIPIAQRQALVLVEWLEMSAEEAGAVLGIAAASVRGRCHRGRESLRRVLGADDE